jgi:acyl-CoA thioesterase II
MARPIEYREVPTEAIKAPVEWGPEFQRFVWFKTHGKTKLSDNPQAHMVAIVYASDHSLVGTGIQSHDREFQMRDVNVMVSLDHCLYFHEVCLISEMS